MACRASPSLPLALIPGKLIVGNPPQKNGRKTNPPATQQMAAPASFVRE